MGTSDAVSDELERLLSEDVDAVRQREQSAFDVATDERTRVVIFGAGGLGRKAMRILRDQAYEVCGFIDNKPALQGVDIDGVRVYSVGDAWERFGDSVAVVVAIYFGEARDTMTDRVAPLRAKGFTKIAHLGLLAWKYPEALLPHYSLDLPSNVPARGEKIREAFSLFTHEQSRRWFVDHVAWRLTLDFELLPRPVSQTIYFHEQYLAPHAEEFLVDGGAFTGDTLLSFVEGFGRQGFYRVLCFEPDPSNYEVLKSTAASCATQGAIGTYPCALGDAVTEITVENSGGPSSRVGRGNVVIPCRMIDEFADSDHWPTFIKLDIEGHEAQALKGAGETMRRGNPVLAVSAYHRQADLWDLPVLIADYRRDYSFRLAPHVSDGWDLVLYAAPPGRFL